MFKPLQKKWGNVYTFHRGLPRSTTGLPRIPHVSATSQQQQARIAFESTSPRHNPSSEGLLVEVAAARTAAMPTGSSAPYDAEEEPGDRVHRADQPVTHASRTLVSTGNAYQQALNVKKFKEIANGHRPLPHIQPQEGFRLMESTALSTRALDLLLLLRGSEPEGLGRADQVSYQIETAILMGILAEGDRLPTESVLAAELGISPITLRQSLASLRTKGLIETSRGRSGGSVIRGQIDPTDGQLQRKLRDASTESLRDLGDLGAAISSMSARLAASRADAQNVAHLEELVQRHRDTRDVRAKRRVDGRFHVAISVAAQSSRLTSASLQLEAELMTLWWSHEDLPANTDTLVEQHEAIVDAIRNRDADGAATLAEAHSRAGTEYLIAQHLKLTMESGDSA